MVQKEQERRSDLPPLIEQLRRFVETPKPGEKPLVYFATRQKDFDYPNRDKTKPNLYRADQLTIDQFMAEIYPYSGYGDFRDLKKAEEWVMPGIDCYVVPTELDYSALEWSFGDALVGAIAPMLEGRTDWEGAIDEALGNEAPKDEQEAMIDGMQKHMANLLPIFQNSGPLDTPHFHANVCFALDNYAEEWLGIAFHQLNDTERQGKSAAEIFNERYAQYGLRFGRMMTIRYSSYKPGKLEALMHVLSENAMRELGVEPDVLEQDVAIIFEKVSVLRDDSHFATYWRQKTGEGLRSEPQIIEDYLAQISQEHPLRVQLMDLHQKLQSLYQFIEKAEALSRTHFETITKEYFGMTADEFDKAYETRLQWLIKGRDEALIGMAQRLGVSPMFEMNSYDSGLFRALSLEDFPNGGILLKEYPDRRFEGKPSRMIVAYPNPTPIEDIATISSGQFSKAIDKLGINGLMLVTNDSELSQLRDQYIQEDLKYATQYQAMSAADIISNALTVDSINESTEVLFVTGLNIENTELIKTFVNEAWKKIGREGRRTGVGPRVVVFSDTLEINTSWLPEGAKHGHLSKGDREINLEIRN